MLPWDIDKLIDRSPKVPYPATWMLLPLMAPLGLVMQPFPSNSFTLFGSHLMDHVHRDASLNFLPIWGLCKCDFSIYVLWTMQADTSSNWIELEPWSQSQKVECKEHALIESVHKKWSPSILDSEIDKHRLVPRSTESPGWFPANLWQWLTLRTGKIHHHFYSGKSGQLTTFRLGHFQWQTVNVYQRYINHIQTLSIDNPYTNHTSIIYQPYPDIIHRLTIDYP